MNTTLLRARWLLSALLIAGAALFAVGVIAERGRGDHHDAVTTAQGEAGESAGHDESGEGSAVVGASESSSETVGGVNLESVPLVIAGVIASLALAALVWRRKERWLLWVAAGFAAAFAALDVAEVVHQIREKGAAIAVIGAIVALVHLAAVLVAEQRASATASRPASA